MNDRIQLAALERQFQTDQAKKLMQQGVHLIDPSRFDLRGNLTVGQDVRIDINVIVEGECEFGDHVEIGAGCIIKNTKIAAGTKFSRIASLIMLWLVKMRRLVLLLVYVQVPNWRLKCILVTSLKSKTPALASVQKPTTLPI